MVFKNSKNPTPPKKSKRKPTVHRTRVERRKEDKHQIFLLTLRTNFTCPFPQREEEEEEEEEEVTILRSSLFRFCFSYFRAKEKDANDVEPYRNRASRRVASTAVGSDLDAMNFFDSAAKGGGLLFAAARRKRAGWTRRERGARQNSGELRGDIRFAR